ncbi:MAG: roadblock/LC7 domain-containing protein [Candidatus Hermodarchaeota archaeon]|nr:roadblock/LC7 domain-containing protein [Candidatus Hermodarchaeota archaeon]
MVSTLDTLTEILERLNKTGRVNASIVADDEGFLIASAVRPGIDEKVAAVMGSIIHDAADRAKDELGLGAIRDITLRCKEGTLVCKSTILKEGRPVVLAALIPKETRFFIRAVNSALREIETALQELEI